MILISHQQILQGSSKNSIKEFLCGRWCEGEKLGDKQVFPGCVVHKTKMAATEEGLEWILQRSKSHSNNCSQILQDLETVSTCEWITDLLLSFLCMWNNNDGVFQFCCQDAVPSAQSKGSWTVLEVRASSKDTPCTERKFFPLATPASSLLTYPSWHDPPPPSCPPCLPSPQTKQKYNTGIVCKG